MHHFHVPDMTCGGCLRSVTRAIQALDPQARVEADLDTRTVRVESAEEETSLLEALGNGGFPARAVSRQSA
ncbi:heavy-metal-associated domain-containing protein [Microvirga arsenatis]|uniref:Copper chaperone n=1 Tax=Microvirga arsenatis TaxID=2692265 RepID=A0ABW9Z1B4_9HYPH|nr:heavy-metal-associated domain-containing protein [Microvirga arsenatis]NBJ13389.1 copper chaperone [Microvirga arsenatis]NBJ26424.1 copper chaperone [Microvirga arsenatis]